MTVKLKSLISSLWTDKFSFRFMGRVMQKEFVSQNPFFHIFPSILILTFSYREKTLFAYYNSPVQLQDVIYFRNKPLCMQNLGIYLDAINYRFYRTMQIQTSFQEWTLWKCFFEHVELYFIESNIWLDIMAFNSSLLNNHVKVDILLVGIIHN